MTLDQINLTLNEHGAAYCPDTWLHADRYLRIAFASEMEGRQYGWEALCQAWEWFYRGWRARKL